MKYSWLLSLYKSSKIEELKQCIESLNTQTYLADQCVIVVDGEILQEISEYLDTLVADAPNYYTIVRLSENVGLGGALGEGMKSCRNEVVARMDTDDIAVVDRMEKQMTIMQNNENIGVVGGQIKEFCGQITNVVACRKVPTSHEDICQFLKKRSPFNHMTVTLRKSLVEKAEGYQTYHFAEDMYLWVRMYLTGCQFCNCEETLAYARVDESMYRRRGGLKYYRSEKKLFKFMFKNGVINLVEYTKTKIIRFTVHVLMPNWLRQWFYTKFARAKTV